jgi:hypothetical protein
MRSAKKEPPAKRTKTATKTKAKATKTKAKATKTKTKAKATPTKTKAKATPTKTKAKATPTKTKAKATPTKTKASAKPASAPVNAGDVIAIPLPNARWGAICLLGLDVLSTRRTAWRFYVVDGFWDTMPTQAHVAAHEPMGDPYELASTMPGVPDVWKAWFTSPYPPDFVVVGHVELTDERRALDTGPGTMVFQSGDHFRAMLHDKWRERFDAPALDAERAAARAAYDAEQTRLDEERKATNTLPKMAKEKPFAHWRGHWGARVVRVVTDAFAKATNELVALDGTGAPDKEAVFHRLVGELNEIYDRDGCIETGEREELVARIEEMGRLVGLDNTDERLTGSRDW